MFSMPRGLSPKSLLMGVLLLSLSACASHLSQGQCLNMNWFELGVNDGEQGKPKRDLTKDIKDCAKFKVTVPADEYARGWRRGIRQFCRPSHGYTLGTQGRPYPEVCPGNLRDEFRRAWRGGLRQYCVPSTGYTLGRQGAGLPNFCAPDQANRFRTAYDRGRRIFDIIQNLKAQISNKNQEITQLNHRIKNTQQKIKKLNRELVSGVDPTTGKPLIRAQRQAMVSQIRFLRGTIAQGQNEIETLEFQKNSLERQLNDYQSR